VTATLPAVLVAIAAAALIGCAVLAARLRQQAGRHRRAIRALAARLQTAADEAARLAAAAERERIYADLHDDLGARLLDLVYRAPTPAEADRVRAILQDLRDVVTRSRGTPGTLGDVLADIRAEAVQRLAAAGIELVWDAPPDLPEPVLDPARALHLYRIVREAISNVIQHARAKRLRVRLRVADAHLRLELTDDGDGRTGTSGHAGRGMHGMRERANELDGAIRWAPGTEGGTKVLLELPLPAAEDAR